MVCASGEVGVKSIARYALGGNKVEKEKERNKVEKQKKITNLGYSGSRKLPSLGKLLTFLFESLRLVCA